ncbi:MAG: hypothetical protein K6G50_01750 [bacterium]|nr:hypothetical protein [bacterium]
MDNFTSFDEIQEAMKPYVMPYLPEDRFWNQTLLFLEENKVKEYKSATIDRTGIRIFRYHILEQDAIDQNTLYYKLTELLYDNIYLENKIVLTPSILTLNDGSIKVEIALDPDVDENLCSDIITKFFDGNDIDIGESSTVLYSNDVKVYIFLIPKQFGVDQETLFHNAWNYLYNNDYLDKITVTLPSLTTFFNGKTKICIVIDPEIIVEDSSD